MDPSGFGGIIRGRSVEKPQVACLPMHSWHLWLSEEFNVAEAFLSAADAIGCQRLDGLQVGAHKASHVMRLRT